MKRRVFAVAGGLIRGRVKRICRPLPRTRWARGARLLLLMSAVSGVSAGAFGVQAPAIAAEVRGAGFPDAPEPQTPAASPTPKANPCPQPNGFMAPGNGNTGDPAAAVPGLAGAGVHPAMVPCQKKPLNLYQRFVNGPKDKVLTPRDKAWLAARDVVDPFNLITIGGEAGISIGLDAHTAYGPGMPGYARYVGVSFTQDLTGEFFGTFLIPSIAHQDPHYHRMEGRRIPRRVLHAVAQIFWTESDYGKGMPNYANLVGFAVDDAIANLYVPGRQTEPSATAARYVTGLASAPIGNFVNEFLPDVASHIHVQIVILQRIINQVARQQAGNSTAGGEGLLAP